MRLQKTILFVLLGACLSGPSWSAVDSQTTQAYFASVEGKVTVLGSDGANERKAHQDSKIQEGERVITGKESSATLVMFDGSQLKISAKSAVTLSKLQKPSPEDKILEFKLLVGHILAKVKKLTSSSSSFEVDAGGVVCGVRGTQFAMEYIPKTHSLFLNVVEGSVFTRFGPKEVTFAAGQKAHFTHVPTTSPNGQGTGGQVPNTKKGTTPNGNGQNNNGTGSGSQGSNNPAPNSNGTGNNSPGTGGNNPSPVNPETNPLSNPALGDLNNNFQQGILINSNNNLSSAQQTLNIQLHVGAGETVP